MKNGTLQFSYHILWNGTFARPCVVEDILVIKIGTISWLWWLLMLIIIRGVSRYHSGNRRQSGCCWVLVASNIQGRKNIGVIRIQFFYTGCYVFPHCRGRFRGNHYWTGRRIRKHCCEIIRIGRVLGFDLQYHIGHFNIIGVLWGERRGEQIVVPGSGIRNRDSCTGLLWLG